MINLCPIVGGVLATLAWLYGIHLGRQIERADAAKLKKAMDEATVPFVALAKEGE